MTVQIGRTKKISVGETRTVSVAYDRELESSELLTGTPTVTEVTTNDLTISNANVNSSSVTVEGVSLSAGNVVQFQVSGQQSGTTYEVKITVSTDSANAQTFVNHINLKAE